LIQLQHRASQEALASGKTSAATARELEALSETLRPRLQRMIQGFQQGLGQSFDASNQQPTTPRPPRSPFGP
jgi:hypothetical protein